MIIVLLGCGDFVRHLDRLRILHGVEVVLEITTFFREGGSRLFSISAQAFSFLLGVFLFLLRNLLRGHHSPTKFLDWDQSEDVLLDPIPAIPSAFVVSIASNMDVEVISAIFVLPLTIFGFVLMFSTLLVAVFALQHGSDMKGLKDLLAIPLFELCICQLWEHVLWFLIIHFCIFIVTNVAFNHDIAVEAMFLSQV